MAETFQGKQEKTEERLNPLRIAFRSMRMLDRGCPGGR